jgi:glycosyltransferase involved in cell wall biosynthesis
VSTAESPRISVLIIVKDEPEIEKTLELLHDQCKEANAECVVVDASEHRLDSIRTKHPWVNWIDYTQANQKITISHQRNIAVAAAHSSILLFCDAGGTPSKNWISNISKPLLEGKQHLVGGPILFTNDTASTVGENIQKDGEILKVSTTANIGFTRSSFDLVEGFNQSLSYGSDADFIWKLAGLGIKHICVNSAVMGLDGGSTRRELKRNWIYGKTIVSLFELHPNKRIEKFKSNPELWGYPLLLMMWVGSLILVLKNPLLLFLPLVTTFILIIKNIREQHPFRIVSRHYVYGAGTIYQIVVGSWHQRKLLPVLLFPSANDRSARDLKRDMSVSVAETPRISVLIIVKDEPEIEKTLELLYDQCKEVNAECVVVDASEHRLDSIRTKHPWVNWINYQQPLGLRFTISQQRNIAVDKSKGNILVFCDAGGEPCKDWLKNIIEPIVKKNAKITGGPVKFISKAAPDYGFNNQLYGFEIQVPTTANMAVNRAAFDLARGFDENLTSGEDAAFVWTLNRNNIIQFAVPEAIMGLEGGNSRREITRAWRYGKSMFALLHKFPEKRRSKQKSNPELLVYPILVTMIIISLVLIVIDVNKSKIVILSLIIIYMFLAFKNRKSNRPWFGLLYKTIHAFSMCLEILRRKIFHRSEFGVMSYPADSSRYLVELEKAFTQLHFRVDTFYQPTGSATFNVLFLPFFPLIMRLQGYKILHIHWLFQFKLHWQVSKKWKYIMRQWFTLWILITRILGIKIVWTVHDPLPHEKIFDNDLAVSELLINNCSSLIALNKISLEKLQKKNSKNKVMLIPEGPLIMPTTISKMDYRNLLQVAPEKRLIVLAGHLQPYKGVSALLEGAFFLPNNFAIRIAGRADAQYQKELEVTLLELKSQNIDIDIAFGHMTDEEYGAYLKSADFICIPFKEINNSGSINSALCAGVPVIVPNIDSLDWVPREARLDLPYDSEEHFDFKELFKSLELLSVKEHSSMHKAALNWATTLSWKDVANRHVDVYKELSVDNE